MSLISGGPMCPSKDAYVHIIGLKYSLLENFSYLWLFKVRYIVSPPVCNKNLQSLLIFVLPVSSSLKFSNWLIQSFALLLHSRQMSLSETNKLSAWLCYIEMFLRVWVPCVPCLAHNFCDQNSFFILTYSLVQISTIKRDSFTSYEPHSL